MSAVKVWGRKYHQAMIVSKRAINEYHQAVDKGMNTASLGCPMKTARKEGGLRTTWSMTMEERRGRGRADEQDKLANPHNTLHSTTTPSPAPSPAPSSPPSPITRMDVRISPARSERSQPAAVPNACSKRTWFTKCSAPHIVCGFDICGTIFLRHVSASLGALPVHTRIGDFDWKSALVSKKCCCYAERICVCHL